MGAAVGPRPWDTGGSLAQPVDSLVAAVVGTAPAVTTSDASFGPDSRRTVTGGNSFRGWRILRIWRDGASAGGDASPRARGEATPLQDGGMAPPFLFWRQKVKRGGGISPRDRESLPRLLGTRRHSLDSRLKVLEIK